MSEDIIFEREGAGGRSRVMKLDADEEALLNEIEIQPRKKKRGRKPPVSWAPPTPPDEEEDDFDDFAEFSNPMKSRQAPPPPPEYAEHDEEEDPVFEQPAPQAPQFMSEEDKPSAGFKSIEEEKADLLNKLARLEKKGFNVNKRLNIYSSIQELRTEVNRVMYGIEVDQSIKFSRRMLIACITGVEFLNKRYNPFDLQLEGWSENVMENVDDYDGVFEELHNKYKSSIQVAPEVKLIMMLGGSAMMFHLTNSMFKTAIPNMNDVLKQNPDLVKNMMTAVQNTAPRTQGNVEDPTQRPTTSADGGRYEMKGPGLDISQLMGGIMMPPPPAMNTTLETVEEGLADDNESMSDIVSISGESTGGETKDVSLNPSGKRRGRGRPKKNEVSI